MTTNTSAARKQQKPLKKVGEQLTNTIVRYNELLAEAQERGLTVELSVNEDGSIVMKRIAKEAKEEVFFSSDVAEAGEDDVATEAE